MAPLSIAFVIAAAVLSSPSPSPQPTLKTIVTVHSSQFCSVLRELVRPALAALLQNDQSIKDGHSVFVAAGDRIKHGGIESPSDGLRTAPKVSPSSGDTILVESRLRRLAKTIEDNIAAIETILTDKKRFAVVAAGENTTLLSIASQLNAIVGEQRTAVNIISGQAEGAELAALYNRDPSWGGADATHGVSPVEAMAAGHGQDGHAQYDVWAASEEGSVPFYDPYEPFARTLEQDQHSIAQSEDAASKSITDAYGGCN
ncbi:MAG: hypothetical protein JO302_04795 [Candidatus Eremiobacteraeota bacterium]|nr:hypothetical protein [Candidatus Eremiobacteraeota bacterium]